MNKKAAMFGLDARIALAIFGALSVISGAALYSAIKTAKTEQARQFLEEYIKASEQYLLDTGQDLPMRDVNYGFTLAGDLIVNRQNLKTWKGPYMSGEVVSDPSIRDSFTYSIHNQTYQRIYLRKSSTWTLIDDLSQDELCVVGGTDCSEYHTILAAHADATDEIYNIYLDLDKSIDNNDGELAGKVRYNHYGAGVLMYKGRMREGKVREPEVIY